MKPARTARIINYNLNTEGMIGKNNNFQGPDLVFFEVIKVQLWAGIITATNWRSSVIEYQLIRFLGYFEPIS